MRECSGRCGGDGMRVGGLVTRRTVAIGAGTAVAGLLAACAGESAPPSTGVPATPGTGTGATEAPGDAGSIPGALASVPAADVPVGGGIILAEIPLVVTQPEQGSFRAFSGICTHQGCSVTRIANGRIVCPCHSSMFSIDDGSVVGGPAPEPLPELTVEVEGDDVVVTGA